MSNPNNPLRTPTARKGNAPSACSYVFSSPARDVGWSPSAANTPLDALFYDIKSNAASINHIIESNISPIRRNSRFPLSATGMNISRSPAETQSKREPPELGLDGPPSVPEPPPSTPQPMKRLFQVPRPEVIRNQGLGYLWGGVALSQDNVRNLVGSGSPEPRKNCREDGIDVPLIYSSPPGSPRSHTIEDSPVKPRRIPIFPSPAAPPPFVLYPPSPAHTSTDLRATRVPGTGAPPSMCYPSAEPLDGDPFLVRVPKTTEELFADQRATGYGPGLLGLIEVAGTIPSPRITSPDEDLAIKPTNISSSSGKPRIPRKRPGPLGGRSRRTKEAASKPRSTYHKGLGAASNEAPVLSRISNDEGPSTPFTRPHASVAESPLGPSLFSRDSFAYPSASASSSFPTPSLTSSLDTPSTVSSLPTPAQASLLPLLEILESPTIMRPIHSEGRLTRSRLRARYAAPTPLIERGLIGGGKLAEPVSNYQVGRYDPGYVGSDPSAQYNESGIDGRPTVNQEMHASHWNSIHDGASHGASGESLQVTNPCLSMDPPSTSLDMSGSSENSPSVLSSPDAKSPVGSQTQLSTVTEDSANIERRAKRTREESEDGNDEHQSPAATKRPKVVGKCNASASPSKAGGSRQINVLREDFGFARATRSQARAVVALLALSASGGDQGTNKAKEGDASEGEISQSEPAKTKAPVTRRTSARLNGKSLSGNEIPIQTPRRVQRTNSSVVVEHAPSRVAETPSDGVRKTRSTTSTPSPTLKSSRVKMSPSNALAHGAKMKVGNGVGSEPEEADHVSDAHHQIPSDLLPRPDSSVVFGSDGKVIQRTFPEKFPIHQGYPKWYRRNPVSTYFMEEDPARKFVLGDDVSYGREAIPMGSIVPNAAKHFNLYTPRFMRGSGTRKFGLCPICVEPVWRGGEGRNTMLNTKISQYNYHMQYYHGICAQTGLPFSPPIAFRTEARHKADIKRFEREVIEEGKCHVCNKWVPIESVKTTTIMVSEIYWWKHAAACHGTSRLAGDENPYIEDNVYLKLREYEALSKKDSEPSKRLDFDDSAPKFHPFDAGGVESQEGGEVFVDLENQELSKDSDSDLTDLDEDADMNTLY